MAFNDEISMDNPGECYTRGVQEVDRGHPKEACLYFAEASKKGHTPSMEAICSLFLSNKLNSIDKT